MKVALAQIESSSIDVQANLEKHINYIQEAIQGGADLIVFPELSLSGDAVGIEVKQVGLTADSATMNRISKLSREIDIVVGVNEQDQANPDNCYNTVFYFSNESLIHRHRKLFLVNYAVFEEAKYYLPGEELKAFDTPLGRVCMLVCNDVWHLPSPYLAALDGTEILIVPANSTRGALDEWLEIPTTWEHMNRAFSAMLGFYTIFVNRVGYRRDVNGEHPYWGGSEIIDEKGQLIIKAPYDDEALVFGEIEVSKVSLQRNQAPLIRDTRLDFYQHEIERLAKKYQANPILQEVDKLAVSPKSINKQVRQQGD